MATDRLRRQLGSASGYGGASGSRQRHDGASASSSGGTENYCLIGTPLPALDSGKRDPNEYKPVWEQEVRDEQGRRRFHGAFTGGFSAGYYNTVGSKEGWTPSSFYSSRKDKHRKPDDAGVGSSRDGKGDKERFRASRPEDFMDEEDLADLREGKGRLQSSENFRSGHDQGPTQSDPLMDMLGFGSRADDPGGFDETTNVSSSKIAIQASSLGTRILQRMGWKPGQGLGPRVTWARRRLLQALLGQHVTHDSEDEPPIDLKDGEGKKKKLFAPPDAELIQPSKNTARHGLGWSEVARVPTLADALKMARKERTQKGRKGGFGISALENDSDGEDEVFSSGHSIEDSVFAGKTQASAPRWDNDTDKLFLGKDANKSNGQSFFRRGMAASRDEEQKTWRDSTMMIAGFHTATREAEPETWFPAPDIPQNWEPDPHRVWSKGAKDDRIENDKAQHLLGSKDRAAILGEARIPGPPPSILNYLSIKERERLDRIKAGKATARYSDSVGVVETCPIPKIDAATAKAALLGYMPFADDKLQRYRAYLRSQISAEHDIELMPGRDQHRDTFHTELNEFARSAAMFKPSGIAMASRFESSAPGSTDAKAMEPGLHRPPKAKTQSAEESARMQAERLQQDEVAEKARIQQELDTLSAERRNARLGNFGPGRTRTVTKWIPDRLLCKRFNVPPPYRSEADNRDEDSNVKLQKTEMFGEFGESKVLFMEKPDVKARWEAGTRQLQQMAAARAWEAHTSDRIPGREAFETLTHDDTLDTARGASTDLADDPAARIRPQATTSINLENVGLGESKDTQEDAKYVKPSIDIFKAIFADSDLDESGDEGPAAAPVENRPVVQQNGSAEKDSLALTSGKLLFKPRKREAVDGEVARSEATTMRAESTPKPSKKSKSGTAKDKKGRKMLTFSLDEEDGDVPALPAKRARQDSRTSNQPSSNAHSNDERTQKQRVRASDLF